jgi:transcriptional regulator with XRE-family HTH domain
MSKTYVAERLEEFGKAVRRARVQQGMTQQQLADIVGIDIRNIQRIEAAEINPVMTTIAGLQKALRCSWEVLLGKPDS